MSSPQGEGHSPQSEEEDSDVNGSMGAESLEREAKGFAYLTGLAHKFRNDS